MDLDTIKKKILQFWKSENKHLMILRDVLVAVIAVCIVLLLLWSYTGQWFAAPIVAIESGSMEHTKPVFPNDPPFGRLGTIDAGDMVLVQKVYSRKDVQVRGGDLGGEYAKRGSQTYGDYGDVIIYYPDGNKQLTPIIHRAICWVEISINNGERTYTIKEFGVYNETSFGPIEELGLDESVSPAWDHSGYLTKGDHNPEFDNLPYGGIRESTQPIKIEWISGKARQEIPWFGTINLFFSDITTGQNNVGNVHGDCLLCLGIVIALIISIPILLDVKDYIIQRRNEEM